MATITEHTPEGAEHAQQHQQQQETEVVDAQYSDTNEAEEEEEDFDSDYLNDLEDELNDFDGWDNATGGNIQTTKTTTRHCFFFSVQSRSSAPSKCIRP